MKIFKLLSLVCILSLGFSSCETYKDPDVEYSAIFPLSGEWIVKVTDIDADTIVKFKRSGDQEVVIYTYNTASESTAEMWLRVGAATTPLITYFSKDTLGVKGKVNIDLDAKIFSASNIKNGYLNTASNFSVSEGKVLLNDARPPSGSIADSVYFKLTTDNSPGKQYLVSGYRRTGWIEDEPR